MIRKTHQTLTSSNSTRPLHSSLINPTLPSNIKHKNPTTMNVSRLPSSPRIPPTNQPTLPPASHPLPPNPRPPHRPPPLPLLPPLRPLHPHNPLPPLPPPLSNPPPPLLPPQLANPPPTLPLNPNRNPILGFEPRAPKRSHPENNEEEAE